VPLGGPFSFGESKSDTLAKSSEKTIPSDFSFGAKTKTDSEPSKPAPMMAFGEKKSTPMAFGEQKSAPMAFGGQTSKDKDKNKEPATDEISKVCDSNGGSKTSEYLSHIKALNIQVLAWLTMHIEKDPLIVLSPVFKDYDKHLEEIEKLYGASEKGKNKVTQVPPTEKDKDVTPNPLFGNAFGAPPSKEPSPITEKKSDSDSESKSSLFSFGAASSKPLPAQSSGFSFGATAEPSKPTAASSPFSFGTASSGTASAFAAPPASGGFSFKGFGASSSTTPAESNADKKEETQDEDDTPPVVEVKQVEESDALYSKKCKLFYKKEGNYVEKGVGMLYLKSVDGGKTQLLIRADTNLGNVLLNILLSASMPTTRVGKNNVMLVCVPNPPVDPKADSSVPCPMLIRVKATEDADDLKAKLDEFKDK